jgi:hypothetical protein
MRHGPFGRSGMPVLGQEDFVVGTVAPGFLFRSCQPEQRPPAGISRVPGTVAL